MTRLELFRLSIRRRTTYCPSYFLPSFLFSNLHSRRLAFFAPSVNLPLPADVTSSIWRFWNDDGWNPSIRFLRMLSRKTGVDISYHALSILSKIGEKGRKGWNNFDEIFLPCLDVAWRVLQTKLHAIIRGGYEGACLFLRDSFIQRLVLWSKEAMRLRSRKK